MEVWKPIKGYDGFIVSNLGNVKRANGKLIPTRLDSRKMYVLISFEKKTHLLHRLVANAFISNPYNKPDVNHKDGIKTNNVSTNLEWVTKSENTIHRYNTLNSVEYRNKLSESNRGIKHFNAQFTEKQVRVIKWALLFGSNATDLSKLFNINRSAIYDIKYERSWKHIVI